jgi:putative flippase GtrA
MTLHVLILRYVCFAVLATVANLATQRLVLLSGNTAGHFAIAIGAGTIVGLSIKYLFDKRWIFYDTATSLKAHGQQFTLYAGAGLVTTAIFWGTETAFWLIWQTDEMRELGAVLGLSVGYLVKYNLDRRFVFTNARLRVPA